MNRLRLIIYALTMPKVDVERRADEILTSYESRMLHEARQRVIKLGGHWRLSGFTIEHWSPDMDTSDIHGALKDVYHIVLGR